MNGKPRISFVDGSGFIFRAYYALPSLTNTSGVPVGAVVGFCNMLWRIINEHKTNKLAVIFDTPHKNFRNLIFPDYKANRSEPPEDLQPQFKIIREAVDAFGISQVELKGFEADDLIATYTKLCLKEGWSVDIISSDKDLMQLIKTDVRMLDPIKSKVIEKQQVLDKFGVMPEKVVEVQALAGDSVDNIPGVPGVGLKTAAELINKYGNIENLIKKANEITQPKRRESIINNAQNARISLKLATLKDDIPIEKKINELSNNTYNKNQLIQFLDKFEFTNLKNRILAKNTNESENGNKAKLKNIDFKNINYKIIKTFNDLEKCLNRAYKYGIIAINLETTSIYPTKAKIIGISLSHSLGNAYYIPLNHKPKDSSLSLSEKQMDEQEVLNKLKEILTNHTVMKIGHNIKYDITIFKKHGIEGIFPIDDTMLISYCLYSGIHGHNIEELSLRYLDHRPISLKNLVGSGKEKLTFECLDIKAAKDFSCEHTDVILKLWKILKPLLAKKGVSRVYERIEKPLIKIISDMEIEGIKIDIDKLEKLSTIFTKEIKYLENEVFSIAKINFNISSPKQLGEILFEKIGFSGGKKTKSGYYSTGANILEELSVQGHRFPKLILGWRAITKLKTTYTNSLIDSVNEKTNRVHTTFQMTGAQTGRLSSTEPNLQNIPIKSENGKKIRKAFIAKKDYLLLSCDYSQIELRILSQIANVKSLKNAFLKGKDIHKLTASEILNIPLANVTDEHRRQAKAINFGIIYGLSAFGLSKQVGISRSQAKDYIETYFEKYPEIKQYTRFTTEELKKNGHVRTLFGRKINISGATDKNFNVRNYAERQAINAPIQGTAADIIKMAMILIPEYFKKENIDAKMLLQVHDELVFEVKKNQIDQCKNAVKNIMLLKNILSNIFSIPLVIEIRAGENWGDIH